MFVTSLQYFVLHRVTDKDLSLHCVQVLIAVKFYIHVSSVDTLPNNMLYVDSSSLFLACSRAVFLKLFLLH